MRTVIFLVFIGISSMSNAFNLNNNQFSPGLASKNQLNKEKANSFGATEKVRHFSRVLSYSVGEEDDGISTRGSNDATLYKKYSAAVVFIDSNPGSDEGGIGSGAVISADGKIITNWHVVGSNKTVGVIFKPLDKGRQITAGDIRIAKVVRVNAVADLALLQVSAIPPHVIPFSLGSLADIDVGLDVHAIGHPLGATWTYTKGLISQYREDYVWRSDGKNNHQASVIQTQTPINPGNSGGPLMLDGGQLIGINSFGMPDAQGLNYAVSVEEIKKFLKQKKNVGFKPEQKRKCDPKTLFEGRNEANDADILELDTTCDKKRDVIFVKPDDKTKSLLMYVFEKSDQRPNGVVLSYKRSFDFWDISYWDNELKEQWPIVGLHKAGNPVPYKFVSREDYEKQQKK